DYGLRMLMRSADVQLQGAHEGLGKGGNALVLGVALVAALGLFIGVPYLATSLVRDAAPSSLALNVAEGLLRLVLLVGYLVAISYEVLRFGAAHERNPLMRILVAPGLLLQRITTRRPDSRMIEVAVASLEEALAGDREAEAAA